MRLWTLPAVILILGLLSVLTLSSIAPSLAPRQLVFFMVGFAVFGITSKISFKRIQNFSLLGYVTTIFLLILTLVIGNVTKGSTRWIDIGGLFAIQSSQLAIPTTALYLLTFFKDKSLESIKNLSLFLMITAVPAVLILVEPDLGTTIVYLLSIFVILFLEKTKKTHMALLVAAGMITITIAWFFVLEPYQKSRITSFISPTDSQGSGYNARQSLIAVGSGQTLGRGLGQGVQSHLRFLPERQTDFIFASFAEEFGFFGSSIVILLYTALIATTLTIGRNANSRAEQLFCYVTATMTLFQTGVNIGMNTGLMPITGITLPFFSYGGSSIITLLTMHGIVQSVHNTQKQKVTLHLE